MRVCVCVRSEIEEAGRPIGENTVRVFVALFPYDPVSMSPNPDAAEEELPFRDGQIIKVLARHWYTTAADHTPASHPKSSTQCSISSKHLFPVLPVYSLSEAIHFC